MVVENASDKFILQEIYDVVVRSDPCYLEFVPDKYKTQGMCSKALEMSEKL